MTIATPNGELGPTGAEVDEFLAPTTTPAPPPRARQAAEPDAADHESDHNGDAARSPLQAALLDVADRSYADVVGAGLERVARTFPSGLSSALQGDWLGHPVHPALTDFSLGCWTCASLLDLVGGRPARPAATRLVALGLLGVPVTAAAGLADWQPIDGPRARRVGATHAAANVVAALCYFVSWRARRAGRHGFGVAAAMAGASVTVVSGYLGGELVFGVPERDSSS